jgi:hypothetical protein
VPGRAKAEAKEECLVNRIMPGQRPRELELRTRVLDWMKARARDRRSWPSPPAWAQALLQLAGTALVRAQAQARILGSDHREFFALMASVELIAADRFFVICEGKMVYVVGHRRGDDPRPAVISKAAGLAEIGHSELLAAADQQETAIRRLRRSHRRGLQLAEDYIARLPRVAVPEPAKARASAAPYRRPARLLEPCGGGWFIFNGQQGKPLEVDLEEDFSAEWSVLGEVEVEL